MTLILSGSDGLSDVDGTAAAPALRGTDANTGIFFPAADTIAFAEGGVEAARFDSAGNLGIGATTINNAVTTYRGAGVNNYIQFTNATTGTASTDGCLIGVAADDTSLRLRVLEAASIIFTTSDTERARIGSSGQFFVGTTSNPGGGTSVAAFSGEDVLNVNNTAAGTGSVTSVYFKRNATTVGSITVTGSATAYVTSSDYRLKENIAPMTGALANVALLKPVTYKWKVDGSDGQGFIAHELQAVVPDCVSGAKDAVDADGNPVHQGIDTSFLVATLTAALQEAHGLIKNLEQRVAALEAV
jgi:hypothetical protein